jgi:hypothetical protein
MIAMDRDEGKTSMLEKGGALTIEIMRKKKMAIHINVAQSGFATINPIGLVIAAFGQKPPPH